jgi:DNA-binding LacI/PurR family transcriptional regulator
MSRVQYIEIVDAIADKIASGEFSPGDPIMSGRQIELTYSVSSTVALRVFKELSERGLIVKRNGLRYCVKQRGGHSQNQNLICVFRPLSNEQETGDNFGNRIIYGMMKEALFFRRNLIFPMENSMLANRIPTANEFQTMADAIFLFPSISGILIDNRICDDFLRRFILPRCNNIPIAVVGRKTSLPFFSSALPTELIGKEVAVLASKMAKRFVFYCNPWRASISIDTIELKESFCRKLRKMGVKPTKIFQLESAVSSEQEREEHVSYLVSLLKKADDKVFMFCDSDYIANELYRMLEMRNLLPDRDYFLMGFGGVRKPASNLFPKETVMLSAEEIGLNAVDLLCEPATKNLSTTRFCNWKINFG